METNDINNDKVKVYELGYLLVPSIAEEKVTGEVETIKSALEKYQASIISEDFPKLQPLAYQMLKVVGSNRNKYDNGYFGWIKFEVVSGSVPLLKADLDKNASILRFMIIHTVRENTMVTQKMVFKPVGEADKEKTDEEPLATVSEEELDKTIENLVVE